MSYKLLVRSAGLRHRSRGLRLSNAHLVRADSKGKTAFVASDSFMMNVFRGRLNTKYLFPYPKPLSADQEEELKMLTGPTHKFFQEVNNAAKNDELETIEPATLQGLKDMGAMGMQVDPELGGVGLNNTQYARMVDIVGAHDLGVGIALGAHQSIGYKGIVLYATPEQKKKYLPKLASGEHIAAYTLTEPSSGSDAFSIRSRAELSSDGKHYILNGAKIWISNGGICDIFTVFAQTPVQDPKTGNTKDAITAFIVERGFGGVTNGKPEKKMGIKCSNTAEVYFDNTKIPVENVLGEVGGGFKVAMNILNAGRFGMAAALSGTMRTAIGRAAEHCAQRVQFGKKIHEFGNVQEKLTQMAMMHYATESVAYLLSGAMDNGAQEFQIEAAISKVFASESAWYCVDECIQLHGGMGFMKEAGLERVLRDLRIFRIFEGANDILRLFVALTGLGHLGSWLGKLRPGEVASLGVHQLQRSMGFSASCTGNTSQHCHPDLVSASRLLDQCISEFGGVCVNMLYEYQKGIIEEQLLLTRLANCAINIYAMSATLSRCTKSLTEGSHDPDYERLLAHMFCDRAGAQTQALLATMGTNGPVQQQKPAIQYIASRIIQNGGVEESQRPLGF